MSRLRRPWPGETWPHAKRSRAEHAAQREVNRMAWAQRGLAHLEAKVQAGDWPAALGSLDDLRVTLVGLAYPEGFAVAEARERLKAKAADRSPPHPESSSGLRARAGGRLNQDFHQF